MKHIERLPKRRATHRAAHKRQKLAWNLSLYVADESPRSLRAFQNLKGICEGHLHGRYHINVINLLEHPDRARRDQIIAVPTIVRRLPKPLLRMVGDLSNMEIALTRLGLK